MRRWVRDVEVERGEWDGVTVAEQAEIRELRRRVRRLEEES
jgi:transposase-like protein